MSYSVQEEWTGNADAQTQENGTAGQSTVERVFNVVPLSGSGTRLGALYAAGLPLPNSPHPESSILRARRRNVQQTGPQYYVVTIGYDALVSDPTDPTQSPLTRPPVFTYSSVTQEVEIDEDRDGKPIQTINGEPLVGVTRPFTDLVITVQRNLPTFNPVSISTYMNKVNSATWYGFPAGTVRITDISATSVFSDDFAYWDVSVAFQVRRGYGQVIDAEAWDHRCAHQGYIVKVGGQKVYATTDDDVTVAQPVMLDLTTGAQLAAGVGAYINFPVLDEIDFNGLNLL